MKVLSLCIAAGLLALASASGCPPLWTQLGTGCYRYFGFPRPMRIAERVCAQFTSCSDTGTTAVAHLASIGTGAENVFLYNLIESVAPELPPAPVWIGLNDIVREGMFTWPDGTPYVYKNWERGHPTGNARCAAMPGERPGAGWINMGCREAFSYICKMPADVPPQGGAPVDPGMGPAPGPYQTWGYYLDQY